jgi:threonine aldolase
VASGLKPTDYTQYCDTVSMCFSKGLGAPVGSIVAGSAETIHRVHRFRKMFGGGMRQPVSWLRRLTSPWISLLPNHVRGKLRPCHKFTASASISVQTNIVYFDVPGVWARGVAQRLGPKECMIATSRSIRGDAPGHRRRSDGAIAVPVKC